VVEQGDSLWAVHTVRGSGLNSALRWYEIDEPTNTLLQTGLIEDLLQDYIDASIAVNAFGQVVIINVGSSFAAKSASAARRRRHRVRSAAAATTGRRLLLQDYVTRRNR
jgi:hypothetical protein